MSKYRLADENLLMTPGINRINITHSTCEVAHLTQGLLDTALYLSIMSGFVC